MERLVSPASVLLSPPRSSSKPSNTVIPMPNSDGNSKPRLDSASPKPAYCSGLDFLIHHRYEYSSSMQSQARWDRRHLSTKEAKICNEACIIHFHGGKKHLKNIFYNNTRCCLMGFWVRLNIRQFSKTFQVLIKFLSAMVARVSPISIKTRLRVRVP